MAKSLLGALALASLPSALAFRNTSPLFLFSTADLNVPATQNDIVFANEAVEQVKNAINSCPTSTYIVVRQEGVSSTDFVDSRAAPSLAHYLSGKGNDVRRSLVIPEVIAPMQVSLEEFIKHHCSAEVVQMEDGKWTEPTEVTARRVVSISFAAPAYQKSAALQKADSELEDAIIDVAGSEDYTVIYTTTPPTDAQIKASLENEHGYEMEHPFDEAVQMELKRDLSSHKRAVSKEGGLFERYQYFTPPIFMGFIAIAPLFLIIIVGLRALSSLEVSYFAFSKEMGPAAQRKQ